MIDTDYDINWHDARLEMPGTAYQDDCDEYLVRYTFEDEDRDCFFDKASLCNGRFVIYFDQHPEEQRESFRKDARVINWCYIDHPDDYCSY